APGQDAEHRALVGQALLLPGLVAVGGAEEGAALAHHHQRTVVGAGDGVEVRIGLGVQLEVGGVEGPAVLVGLDDLLLRLVLARLDDGARLRSEEHTSELQSRENLVCRLLLEKKKKKPN